MKKIKSIILITLIFYLSLSTPVYANEINDCTGKVYSEVYNNLTNYEKQQLSMFDVFIVNKKLEQTPKNKNDIMLGYIDCDNKIIYVSNNKKNSNDTVRILFHELGHSMDYVFVKQTSEAIYNGKIEYFDSSHWIVGYYSKSEEFMKIFKEEKKNIEFYSDEKYFLTDSSEYFAECTAIYHMNGDKLKRLAPKTYEFLDRVINQEI